MSPAPIDFHDAIEQAVEEVAPIYSTRSLTHARTGEGACVADAHRLAQLVGNLVSNAMTYGDPASPVTVTSSIEDRSFAVAVHNAGKAIPEELQATLFEPMTRGAHVSSKTRSVGLGLFIVREIARAHGRHGVCLIDGGSGDDVPRHVLARSVRRRSVGGVMAARRKK